MFKQTLRRTRHKRPRGPSRTPRTFEHLENRILLTTTLFLDFGAGFAAGGLNTTVAAFRDIDGANTGTNMTNGTMFNPMGMMAADDLNFARIAFDFDGNGTAGEVSDVTALAAAVVPLVQRALEPFDINVVVAAASNLAAAVTSLGANNGDASGEFDAYNFIADITSTTLVTMANATGSVGQAYNLFGRAALLDLNAQAGNNNDEATMTFVDQVLASTTIFGTPQFNQNLAQRIAYTTTHEAFHTFTEVHTVNLESSGDVIRVGSNTRQSPFMVTRFDLSRQGGFAVAEPNNYLQLATDPDIGLRDSNSNAIPDLAYVTGTGAHDQITLSDPGGGMVDVVVNAFSDQAQTALIASESYSINLASDTDGEILLDAGINVDNVVVDATIPADMRLRGGTGLDGVAVEADLLDLQSGGLTGTYTPGVIAGAGTVNYAGGAQIQFSEFENVEADNVPIVVQPLMLSSLNLNENDILQLSGEFINIDTMDTHEVTVDWGDGTLPTVFTLVAGDRDFLTLHTYLDDDPSGTASDNYTITVTIEDEDADMGTANAMITVNNLDPVIVDFASDATFGDKAEEGEAVNILANFTDVGTLDTHTAVVDWGDGSALEVVTVNQGAGFGTVAGSHVYAAGGIYAITVTLTDDDTGSVTADTTAVVTGVGLNNGVLYIIGSSQDDIVSANQTGKGLLKVHASFIPEAFRSFDAAAIDKIISYLCDGDDHLTISNKVTTPAIVHGGDGNDHLNAGGGPTVLLGDNGDDTLVGQGGRNVLIGGLGSDKLIGGKRGDVLIGGSTTSDEDDDALMAVAMAWNSGDDYAIRALAVFSLLAEFDDGDEDILTGSSSRDLFYDGAGDKLTDVKPDEIVIL